MFEVIRTEGRARRGVFTCAHGTAQTPVFMNVGTQGAIKGAVSAHDLAEIGCQIELSNTYHLHLRPGDEVVRDLGGLHRFMDWKGPILTDSGGFQVFSLSGLRKITEEGVTFASHIDGRRIFMGPEESMRIQSHLCLLYTSPSRPPMSMSSPPVSGLTAGWCAVRRSTRGSMPSPARSIRIRCCSASTRGGLTPTCACGIWTQSPSWTATATPSAGWLWGRRPR